MRKEVIWAIICGILFGLILAIGIYRVNKRVKSQTKTPANIQKTPTTQLNEFKIALNKPENNDVLTEELTTIEGITRPLSNIIISTPLKDYFVKTNDKGIFNSEIELDGGVNQIQITAIDPKGAKSQNDLIVVYSSLFEKIETQDLKQTENATQSALRTKIQAKVNALLDKPKAYIGTVTDITGLAIEIKSSDGQIKQVSVNENASVTKTFPTSKDVKITDIAIGDTIASLGYKDENQVLETQRILIIEPIVKSVFEVTLGTISKVTKTSVFIDETEYTFDKSSKIKFSSLKNGQQIIIVGKRSLFVLE